MPGPLRPSLERLRTGVDAVLVPRGFAPGQVGSDDHGGQMTWCAAADDLAARFPVLPTSREPAEGWSTRCTDVVLDVAGVDGHWLVTGVDLEEHRLDQALAHVGLAGAAREAAALVGTPAGDCASSLPALLTRLLDASASRRRGAPATTSGRVDEPSQRASCRPGGARRLPRPGPPAG